MTPRREKGILVVGLPGTGKTTFLAALSYLLNAKEIKTSLELIALQPNEHHISTIRDQWARGERVLKSPADAAKVVSLAVGVDDEEYVISLPDVSGEVTRDHWVTRKWPIVFDELVRGSAATVLFLHPLSFQRGAMLDPKVLEMLKLSRAALEQDAAGGKGVETESARDDRGADDPPNPSQSKPKPAPEPGKDMEAKITAVLEESPTQVRLVDLLQAIRRRQVDEKVPILVVISAWDLIQGGQSAIGGGNPRNEVTPAKWLEENMALLSGYLKRHEEADSVRIVGVSATGGDLKKKRKQILGKLKASERLIAIDEDGVDLQHDISKPIKWLLTAG